MKKISLFFTLAFALAFNANASTVLVGSSDYDAQVADGLDPIIAYTSMKNSGDKTQMAWMTDTLTDIYGKGNFEPIWTLEKIEFEDKAFIDAFWGNPVGTDSKGGDIHSGNLLYGQEHYLVKIGEGLVKYDTFLYKNVGGLLEAMVGLGWLDYFSELDGPEFDIYRISHLSEVPVPAAFWLFGSALIGFVGFSRRTKIN